ncbi:MAG: class I SAM-dependent methyltransferase [Pirellulales bacterium]|nr:class I SAM-dependent methyltransferase [Pirellulales bacterium]
MPTTLFPSDPVLDGVHEVNPCAPVTGHIDTSPTTRSRLLRKSLYRALRQAVLQDAATCVNHPAPMRVLDVGCGRGELLGLLARDGLVVTGVDPEPDCVAMSSRHGACVTGSVEEAADLFQPGQFDVIVLSHVLEHLPDPVGVLRTLRAMNAAAYVFAVPNVHRAARLVRALVGSARPDHPLHLFAWGRAEFTSLLGSVGFRPLRWRRDRVTINPLGGAVGLAIGRVLAPLEVHLLPHVFPELSSSLIVTCQPK